MYSTKFPEHVTESPEKNWSVKSAAIKVLLNDFYIKKIHTDVSRNTANICHSGSLDKVYGFRVTSK